MGSKMPTQIFTDLLWRSNDAGHVHGLPVEVALAQQAMVVKQLAVIGIEYDPGIVQLTPGVQHVKNIADPVVDQRDVGVMSLLRRAG